MPKQYKTSAAQRAAGKKYYKENKEWVDFVNKEYRLKNWEKIRPKMLANVNKWRKENPEKIKEAVARQRSKEILRRNYLRSFHPDLYYQKENGDWYKKPLDPEEKKKRQRESSRRTWAKITPEQRARHNEISREYMRRKQAERKARLQQMEEEKLKLLERE